MNQNLIQMDKFFSHDMAGARNSGKPDLKAKRLDGITELDLEI